MLFQKPVILDLDSHEAHTATSQHENHPGCMGLFHWLFHGPTDRTFSFSVSPLPVSEMKMLNRVTLVSLPSYNRLWLIIPSMAISLGVGQTWKSSLGFSLDHLSSSVWPFVSLDQHCIQRTTGIQRKKISAWDRMKTIKYKQTVGLFLSLSSLACPNACVYMYAHTRKHVHTHAELGQASLTSKHKQ